MARFFLLMALVLAGGGAARAEDGWREILEEDGIRVSQREVPGRSLPAFRGVGEVDAGLYHVLAVILDVPSQPLWMYQCSEARYVRRESPLRALVYTRMDLPWPVADRDAVLRSETQVLGPGRTLTRFREQADADVPPLDGVVRMPRIRGHFALQEITPGRTRVEYEADADPGGLLPTWVASRASRDNPLRTLQKLRTRVRETSGRYEAFLDRWDPRRARRAP